MFLKHLKKFVHDHMRYNTYYIIFMFYNKCIQILCVFRMLFAIINFIIKYKNLLL